MAADDDDNEVDVNGATADDDCYVSYYNIQISLVQFSLSLVYHYATTMGLLHLSERD